MKLVKSALVLIGFVPSLGHALDLNRIVCVHGTSIISFSQSEPNDNDFGTVDGGDRLEVTIDGQAFLATVLKISLPSWPPVSETRVTLSKASSGIELITIAQAGQVISGSLKTVAGAKANISCRIK